MLEMKSFGFWKGGGWLGGCQSSGAVEWRVFGIRRLVLVAGLRVGIQNLFYGASANLDSTPIAAPLSGMGVE